MASLPSERIPVFRQCPGCGYDVLTGEGTKSCGWYDCPYLPEDFKVFCPACNYNFATGEGQPHCESLKTCEWAEEGFRRAKIVKRVFGHRT